MARSTESNYNSIGSDHDGMLAVKFLNSQPNNIRSGYKTLEARDLFGEQQFKDICRKLSIKSFSSSDFYVEKVNTEIPSQIEYDDISTILNMPLDEAIVNYLKKHESMVSLLVNVKRELKRFFLNEDLNYKLRFTYDSNGLMLEVYSIKSCEEALSCLERFEEEWWIDNMPEPPDELIIDVVFA